MQSLRAAVIGKFCSYLACWLKEWSSWHVLFSQTRNYGNCLYWCRYVRDVNGGAQTLKATVPDRRVWLPAPACVIVAVRLTKALIDAHGALKGAKQLHVRAVRFY